MSHQEEWRPIAENPEWGMVSRLGRETLPLIMGCRNRR